MSSNDSYGTLVLPGGAVLNCRGTVVYGTSVCPACNVGGGCTLACPLYCQCILPRSAFLADAVRREADGTSPAYGQILFETGLTIHFIQRVVHPTAEFVQLALA